MDDSLALVDSSAFPLHEGALLANLFTWEQLLPVMKDKVEKGFSVNGLDPRKCIPLDLCIKLPQDPQKDIIDDVVKFLLKHNANPNHTDATGQTLLHKAAWHGDLMFIKLCVQYGKADIHARDSEGRKPVDLAAIRCHTHVMQYLDDFSIDLQSICRRVIRKSVGKKVNILLQTLPLPPQVKMFLNYYIPYPGFEVVLLPPSPWTKEELWQKKVKADELRTFMLENGSCEFIEEHKSVLESDATEGSVDDELIRVFQDMYLWESFKTVNFEEPVARTPRYSMTKLEKRSTNYTYL